jgi:hypothetical protein
MQKSGIRDAIARLLNERRSASMSLMCGVEELKSAELYKTQRE